MATCLGYDRFYSNHFIAYLLMNLLVKKCENHLRFDKITAVRLVSSFLEHSVVLNGKCVAFLRPSVCTSFSLFSAISLSCALNWQLKL